MRETGRREGSDLGAALMRERGGRGERERERHRQRKKKVHEEGFISGKSGSSDLIGAIIDEERGSKKRRLVTGQRWPRCAEICREERRERKKRRESRGEGGRGWGSGGREMGARSAGRGIAFTGWGERERRGRERKRMLKREGDSAAGQRADPVGDDKMHATINGARTRRGRKLGRKREEER